MSEGPLPAAPRAPSFTAILATRDRPALLADALASVAAQRVAPREVRIGDDGVAPAAEVAASFAALEVTVVRAGGGHAGAARNAAAGAARGDVLAFLDDDDRWLPDHLSNLAAAFADPRVEVAFTDAAVVRERIGADGARVELERRVIAREWDPGTMRHDSYVPPSALAMRRARFERLGGFDLSFRFSEDWDLLLRAARDTTPVRAPGVTVEVRMRETGNSSADFGPERLACLARLAGRHGLPPLEPRTFWEVAALVGSAP